MFIFERLLQNRLVALLLCLLPLILYAVFFEAIALNVNYIAYDDIHVLQIIEQWQQAANMREKLDWLTVGFPEHRIVFTRLVVLFSYWITGFVDFKNLMVISNLLWISQLGILYQFFKKLALPLIYFAPICWILLCVHAFENIFWGTSSLGNFGLLFFVMAAGYFYVHPNLKYLLLALAFSFLATFTYGNGLLTFIIGGIVLALMRRWRDFGYTVVLFILTMLLYALTRAHASPSSLNLTNPANYWNAFVSFFAFVGSSISFDAYAPSTFSMWLSVVWGILLVATILWLLLKNFIIQRRWSAFQLSTVQLFVLFLFLFVCLSALGVVYKRAEWDGMAGMFKGRYRMYPTWLVIICYLVILDWKKWQPSRWFLPLVIGGSVLFNLLILFYAVAPAVNNRRIAVAQEFNSMYNADLIGLKMFELTGEDFNRLQQIYRPDLFFNEPPSIISADVDSLQLKGSFKLDSVYFVDKTLYVNYDSDFIRPIKDFDDGAYILLHSAHHTYMAAGIQPALPLKTFIRRGWYWDRGFRAIFSRYSVNPGKYRIYVLLRQSGVNELLDSGKVVDF